MKAVPFDLIASICECGGIDPNDVQQIVIRPGQVTITALVRDDSGRFLSIGYSDEDRQVATRTIDLPHEPYSAPSEPPQETGAVVGVSATADAEVIRAADLEAVEPE